MHSGAEFPLAWPQPLSLSEYTADSLSAVVSRDAGLTLALLRGNARGVEALLARNQLPPYASARLDHYLLRLPSCVYLCSVLQTHTALSWFLEYGSPEDHALRVDYLSLQSVSSPNATVLLALAREQDALIHQSPCKKWPCSLFVLVPPC